MRRTRTQDEPPLARKGQPVEGPTVWYGADLTPRDVEFRCGMFRPVLYAWRKHPVGLSDHSSGHGGSKQIWIGRLLTSPLQSDRRRRRGDRRSGARGAVARHQARRCHRRGLPVAAIGTRAPGYPCAATSHAAVSRIKATAACPLCVPTLPGSAASASNTSVVISCGSTTAPAYASDEPLRHHISDPPRPLAQELHRDLLFGRGFRVLRGLPVPPAVSFECAYACCSAATVRSTYLLNEQL